jgi:hypothetical protein
VSSEARSTEHLAWNVGPLHRLVWGIMASVGTAVAADESYWGDPECAN